MRSRTKTGRCWLRRCGSVSFLFYLTGLWCFSVASELPDSRVESLVKQAWAAVQREQSAAQSHDTNGQPSGVVGWQYVISPPFPCQWPPKGQGEICYYAYARGLRFGLTDAEAIAAPWGRVRWDVSGRRPPRMEVLSKGLREAGIQGVRPLLPQEMAIYKTAKAVEARLLVIARASTLKGDESAIHRYYCRWSKDNGVAADQIRPFHPGFFSWLDCK